MGNNVVPFMAQPVTLSLAPDTKVDPDLKGPRALPVVVTVSSSNPVTFDLIREVESHSIDNIQAMFVDNSKNSGALVITFSEVMGASISIAPYSQGVYPVFGKTYAGITVTTTNNSNYTASIIFVNVPQPYYQWVANALGQSTHTVASVGSLTLPASSTTYTLVDATITANSVILVMPNTNDAALEIPVLSYAPAAGQAVLTFASNATVDRTYRYVVIN